MGKSELPGPYKQFYAMIYPKGACPAMMNCTGCNFEQYCSKQCQETAWKKYHRVLCKKATPGTENFLESLYEKAAEYERTNLVLITRIMGMVNSPN